MHIAAALLVTAVLAACGTPGALGTPGAALLPISQDVQLPISRDVLLLGEVHDNARGHALRLQALQTLLDSGARPALLMEQFDRELQPGVDRLLVDPHDPAAPDTRIDRLVALAGGAAAGWDWALYRPVLALALRYRLPIVAANVSRQDARAVMRQGLAATGFDPDVPADIAQAQALAIARSHCGLLDAASAGRMVLAQVARDQFMARQVLAHAGRGVVLLAGNGHQRKDVGVPRWLAPALLDRTRVIGFVEAGAEDAALFDQTITVPPQMRDDPCAAMPAPAVPAPS